MKPKNNKLGITISKVKTRLMLSVDIGQRRFDTVYSRRKRVKGV